LSLSLSLSRGCSCSCSFSQSRGGSLAGGGHSAARRSLFVIGERRQRAHLAPPAGANFLVGLPGIGPIGGFTRQRAARWPAAKLSPAAHCWLRAPAARARSDSTSLSSAAPRRAAFWVTRSPKRRRPLARQTEPELCANKLSPQCAAPKTKTQSHTHTTRSSTRSGARTPTLRAGKKSGQLFGEVKLTLNWLANGHGLRLAGHHCRLLRSNLLALACASGANGGRQER